MKVDNVFKIITMFQILIIYVQKDNIMMEQVVDLSLFKIAYNKLVEYVLNAQLKEVSIKNVAISKFIKVQIHVLIMLLLTVKYQILTQQNVNFVNLFITFRMTSVYLKAST